MHVGKGLHLKVFLAPLTGRLYYCCIFQQLEKTTFFSLGFMQYLHAVCSSGCGLAMGTHTHDIVLSDGIFG